MKIGKNDQVHGFQRENSSFFEYFHGIFTFDRSKLLNFPNGKGKLEKMIRCTASSVKMTVCTAVVDENDRFY